MQGLLQIACCADVACFISELKSRSNEDLNFSRTKDAVWIDAIKIPIIHYNDVKNIEIIIGEIIWYIPFKLLCQLCPVEKSYNDYIITISPDLLFKNFKEPFEPSILLSVYSPIGFRITSTTQFAYSVFLKNQSFALDLRDKYCAKFTTFRINAEYKKYDISHTNTEIRNIKKCSGVFIDFEDAKNVSITLALNNNLLFNYSDEMTRRYCQQINSSHSTWSNEHYFTMLMLCKNNCIPIDMLKIILCYVDTKCLFWIPFTPSKKWNDNIVYPFNLDSVTLRLQSKAIVYFLEHGNLIYGNGMTCFQ